MLNKIKKRFCEYVYSQEKDLSKELTNLSEENITTFAESLSELMQLHRGYYRYLLDSPARDASSALLSTINVKPLIADARNRHEIEIPDDIEKFISEEYDTKAADLFRERIFKKVQVDDVGVGVVGDVSLFGMENPKELIGSTPSYHENLRASAISEYSKFASGYKSFYSSIIKP